MSHVIHAYVIMNISGEEPEKLSEVELLNEYVLLILNKVGISNKNVQYI